MRAATPLVVGVADLLSRPGSTRDLELEAQLGGWEVVGTRVPQGATVELDVHLQSVNEGIVAKGTVRAPWVGECRRCLKVVERSLEGEILEIFEDDPTEGETRQLEHDRIDLEPVVRETVLLELPLAPLCKEDCAGLCTECGADRNEVDCGHGDAPVDDRWSALGQITFDE